MSEGVSDDRKAWVSAQTRLQTFLYLLIRDHVPFGAVNKIIDVDLKSIVGVPPDFTESGAGEVSWRMADAIMRGPAIDMHDPVRVAADKQASVVHDAIYTVPFDKEKANEAVWKLHEILRGREPVG
jgi:hypothetical protein